MTKKTRTTKVLFEWHEEQIKLYKNQLAAERKYTNQKEDELKSLLDNFRMLKNKVAEKEKERVLDVKIIKELKDKIRVLNLVILALAKVNTEADCE